MKDPRAAYAPPRRPVDVFLRPIQIFGRRQVSGAIVLLLASVVALGLANSPWSAWFASIWETPVGIGIGAAQLEKPLFLWINDALMAVFFFVVGLEIKRELLAGELATVKKAALPMVAALGGVVVPAGIYIAFNVGTPTAGGWGVPMATDIAFALGALAVLGSRVPTPLKIFLTALAIADDIAAIIVIAVVYTESIAVPMLVAAFGVVAIAIIANLLGVRHWLVYLALGSIVWLLFLKSGIHATLASVVMAFTIPATRRIDTHALRERIRGALESIQDDAGRGTNGILSSQEQDALHDVEMAIEETSPPLQRLEHGLMGFVTFVVMPLFALANAGVTLGDGGVDLTSAPALGIVGGLVIGKPVGIFLAAFLAVKLGVADLPAGVKWRQLFAVSILGGIGFTMALFVGGLAFEGQPGVLATAKLSILIASAIAGVVGLLLLRAVTTPPALE